MDFGKLPNVDKVDFSLPPDPLANRTLLAGLPPRNGPPRIYLGPTGYNMKPWVGKWYPAGAKERDFLRAYGRQFNTIEFNTTHYRIPDTATVDRWREEVPADFRYCPKVPQTISHAGDLGLSGPEIAVFCEAIAGLGDQLGCCFLQLPPFFSVQHLRTLERFIRFWPVKRIPLAVEVRHESFFQPGAGREAYFELLQEANLATVISDVSGRRDVAHMRLTNERVLVRFVGNTLHPSDYTRIEDWAKRLRQWTDGGLHEVFFFTHEPDNLLAPELCAFAVQTFAAEIPEAVLRGPEPIAPPAQQGSLF